MPDETVNDPGTESLRGRVTRGVLWTGGGQVSGQALHWAAVLVLAWFVTPEAFGVVGFGVTCVSVLGALSEFGLGSALIQRADLEDAHVSASFWLSMTAATVLGALMWAAAGLLAAVVHDPTAVPVLRALARIVSSSSGTIVRTSSTSIEAPDSSARRGSRRGSNIRRSCPSTTSATTRTAIRISR